MNVHFGIPPACGYVLVDTHFTDSVLHELYYLGQKKRKKVVAEKALQCTLEVNPADVLEKYEQVRIDMPGLARDGMATSAKQL